MLGYFANAVDTRAIAYTFERCLWTAKILYYHAFYEQVRQFWNSIVPIHAQGYQDMESV